MSVESVFTLDSQLQTGELNTLTLTVWSKPSIWLSSSSRILCTSRSATHSHSHTVTGQCVCVCVVSVSVCVWSVWVSRHVQHIGTQQPTSHHSAYKELSKLVDVCHSYTKPVTKLHSLSPVNVTKVHSHSHGDCATVTQSLSPNYLH